MGGRQEDLYLMRSDGSGLRKLTDDAPRDRFPSFSFDGRRIVFMSDRSGVWELWAILPDGSGLTQLTRSGASPYTPLCSPDGLRIVASNGKDVLVFDLDGKGAVTKMDRLPAPHDDLIGQVVAWSADGRRILLTLSRPDGSFMKVAFFSFDSNKYDVVSSLLRLPTRQGRPLSAFLVSGNRLLLLNADGLYLSDLATSRGRLLLPHASTAPFFGLAVTRDSKTIFLLRLQESAHIWQATLP
jgi:hypothetical protein